MRMKRKIKILGTGKNQVILRRGDDIVLKIPRTLGVLEGCVPKGKKVVIHRAVGGIFIEMS